MFQLCDRAVFQGLWENFQEKKFMGKKERGKTKKTRKKYERQKKRKLTECVWWTKMRNWKQKGNFI